MLETAAAAAAAAALRFASPLQLNAGRAGACTSALQQTSFICVNGKHHLPVFMRFREASSRILLNVTLVHLWCSKASGNKNNNDDDKKKNNSLYQHSLQIKLVRDLPKKVNKQELLISRQIKLRLPRHSFSPHIFQLTLTGFWGP